MNIAIDLVSFSTTSKMDYFEGISSKLVKNSINFIAQRENFLDPYNASRH